MVAAAVNVAALGYAIYAGETQAAVARKGRREARDAAAKAEQAALADARRAEEDENKAAQRSPDLDVLLADQRKPQRGSGSIDADRLLLGRPGQLGI